MQPRRPAVGSVCLWRQVIVLPLCVFLLASCSMRTVRVQNPVLSVGSSETERLRDLLSGKRIGASFTDDTRLEGRVKEIQEGLLRVDIKKTSDPNSVPRGLQDLPTDRISTVKFTRYQGDERTSLATWFALGAIPLVAVLGVGDSTSASAGALAGMGILGYLWGREKDKKNVTVVIQQPEATGGSP